MKKNMTYADRVIRVTISVILATLYFTNTIPGTLGVVLMTVAAVFTITAFINFCPLYHILGIRRWESKT